MFTAENRKVTQVCGHVSINDVEIRRWRPIVDLVLLGVRTLLIPTRRGRKGNARWWLGAL